MSKADIISKRHKDAIYPAAAHFFNQTSGIIDIQNGRTPPCIMGAKEFVDKAYVALKEDGQDVRHMDDLKTISGIMYQAFLGSAADEHKSYILQNQHSYTNALHDALNEFDRLELIKNRKSFQSGLDDVTGFFTLK